MARGNVSVKETLGEMSERWCARNKFPAGLYLTMVTKRNRQKRSDTIINHGALPGEADDRDRLSSALDKLQETLITDIGQRKLTLALRKPNKENIPRNTLISTIRGMDIEVEFPAFEFADATSKRDESEQQIEFARDQVAGAIFSCTEGEGMEEETAVQGAIRAVMKVVDRPTLLKALDEAGVLRSR